MSIDQKSRTSQVDCSKVGRDFEYMTENEIQFKEKNLPPGCSLISGRDNLMYVFLLASFVLYLASYWCDVLSVYTRSFLATAEKWSVHAKAKNAETPVFRQR